MVHEVRGALESVGADLVRVDGETHLGEDLWRQLSVLLQHGAHRCGILRCDEIGAVDRPDERFHQLRVGFGERARAPDVSVELSDPDPAGVLGMVAEGRADVGFVATADVSRLASAFPGLHVRFLVDLPLVLVVSSGRHVAGLRDLESETWIVPAAIQGFPGLDELTDQFWRRNDVTPARIQQVSTLQTALPLIAADMAVGLLPRDGFEVVGGQVAAIDLALDIPPLRAAMVWSAEMQPAPSLDLLFQVIDQAVADAAI